MRHFSVFLGIVVLGAGAVAVGCGGDSDSGSGGNGGSGNSGTTSTTATGGGNTGGGNTGGGNTGGGNTGGGNTGGSAPTGGYCAKSCAAAADCCPPNTPNCPGDYPNNWTCDGGICGAPQCSADADCTFGGALPDWKCLTLDFGGSDYNACGLPCTADADCSALSLKCVGDAKDGSKYCASDATGGGCTSDADCGKGYGATCDTASGACTCEADGECSGTGVDTCVQ